MLINDIVKVFNIIQVTLLLINPITYEAHDFILDKLPQRVHTLKVDMDSSHLEITNGLSHDLLYGFEKTSKIAERNQAVVAVNGMFYDPFGMPYGIMIKDSKIVSMHSTNTPIVCITEDREVIFDEFTIKGFISGETNTISLYGTNSLVPDGSFVLFDSVYGKTTRVRRESINYMIQDDVIQKIIISNTPVSLKDYDYVLTHVTNKKELYFQQGERVHINYEFSNHLNNVKEAFQTGGWLVRNGENVAKDYESFMGSTLAPNPRTIIGVTKDQQLIVKVIEGRTPNSIGVSGTQAADLMIQDGCEFAAYLDGGASSTMVIQNQVVNYPSNDGEERKVAHALLFKINQENDKK